MHTGMHIDLLPSVIQTLTVQSLSKGFASPFKKPQLPQESGNGGSLSLKMPYLKWP